MPDEAILRDIPGGAALIDWFGCVPHFHDAVLLEIVLNSKGRSTLRIHAWQMTDKLDARGYFVLDKHIVVTILLEEVTYIALSDYDLPGIIFDFEVTRTDEGVQLAWDGSYGVEGTLRAKKAQFDLRPGKP